MSKWFKRIRAEKPGNLDEFKGRTLRMMDGTECKVETIVGSKIKQTRFEINGKHHVVILDAYRQLWNAKDITDEMVDLFDQAIVESIEKVEAPDRIKNEPLPKYEKE